MRVVRVKQEYLDARYEYRFVWEDGAEDFFGYLVRGNEIDARGRLIPIFPFEEVEIME